MSTNSFIERFCHKYFQKIPKKSKDEILKQLTHLYLNGRKLEEIVSTVIDSLVLKEINIDLMNIKICLYSLLISG